MSRPNPIPFDTHRFVKRMTEAGMPPGQAEALADEQIALLNTHLATKQDIAILTARQDRLATKQDVADLAARQAGLATKQDVADLAGKQADLAARQDSFATKDELGKVKMEVAVVKARLGLVLWIVSTIGGGVLFLVFRTIWPV